MLRDLATYLVDLATKDNYQIIDQTETHFAVLSNRDGNIVNCPKVYHVDRVKSLDSMAQWCLDRANDDFSDDDRPCPRILVGFPDIIATADGRRRDVTAIMPLKFSDPMKLVFEQIQMMRLDHESFISTFRETCLCFYGGDEIAEMFSVMDWSCNEQQRTALDRSTASMGHSIEAKANKVSDYPSTVHLMNVPVFRSPEFGVKVDIEFRVFVDPRKRTIMTLMNPELLNGIIMGAMKEVCLLAKQALSALEIENSDVILGGFNESFNSLSSSDNLF